MWKCRMRNCEVFLKTIFFAQRSIVDGQLKGDNAQLKPALKPIEFGEALASVDVSAIENALIQQFIQAMIVRLSSGDNE